MIQFSWNITDIDVVNVDEQSNVIRSFKWALIAELENQTAEHNSTYFTSEGLEKTEASDFTDFSDLTLEKCASWVENSLGLEINIIKEELSRKVKLKVNEASKNLVEAPWDTHVAEVETSEARLKIVEAVQ